MAHPDLQYSGWKAQPGDIVDTLDAYTIDSRTFWREYVAKRKPVLFRGHLTDAGWKASARWDNEYLIKTAGSGVVRVEVRDGPEGRYGLGRTQHMRFGDFVKDMADGDGNLYLTSQPVPTAADGHPAFFTHPLTELTDDFEARPTLLGKLVPQQVNVWMGGAPADGGSSSGLHHDFHDNLYILLRGRKRFRLYDPSMAPRMYTNGEIERIYPNGRIVYAGQGDVREDGASASDVARCQARAKAEGALTSAERDVADGKPGALERLAAAEARLEALLEAELDAELDEALAGGDGEENGLHDDFDDEDMGLSSNDEDVDTSSDEDDLGMGDAEQGPDARRRRGLLSGSRKPAGCKKGSTQGAAATAAATVAAAAAAAAAGKAEQQEAEPPSFSEVDLSLPDAELARRYPEFPGRQAALEVVVSAGEMLYLPAGWFHEVTSFGEGSEGGHLAFNYWMHPPDNLDPSSNGYSRPYKSDFFPSLWASRCDDSGRYIGSTFEGVRVDEHEGGTGHTVGVQHPGLKPLKRHDPVEPPAGPESNNDDDGRPRPFEGVHVDEAEGGTGHTVGVAHPGLQPLKRHEPEEPPAGPRQQPPSEARGRQGKRAAAAAGNGKAAKQGRRGQQVACELDFGDDGGSGFVTPRLDSGSSPVSKHGPQHLTPAPGTQGANTSRGQLGTGRGSVGAGPSAAAAAAASGNCTAGKDAVQQGSGKGSAQGLQIVLQRRGAAGAGGVGEGGQDAVDYDELEWDELTPAQQRQLRGQIQQAVLQNLAEQQGLLGGRGQHLAELMRQQEAMEHRRQLMKLKLRGRRHHFAVYVPRATRR